ncbi:DJ-1/PfpI family protein [Thalassotalea fusca]
MNSIKLMKQLSSLVITLALVVFTSVHAGATALSKKVLMVVSSNGEAQGEVAPGYEFEEFAKAYLIFQNNGIAVDVASPKGGKVESDEFNADKPHNAKVLADKAIMYKLANTLKTTDVDANTYNGIFIVGGKGAMFDLPKDKALQQVVADIYQQHGSVAAVCHGPAALVDVKLNDGSYLVDGKAVNSFTNVEEKLFGKKWVKHFDFMLEDKLIERGAKFQASPIMLNHVAVDGRLITGQNPTSTVGVANALVKNLGINPVVQSLDSEDTTLSVVAEFLAGDTTALTKFLNNAEQYQLPLASMYGYYFVMVAQDDEQKAQALSLMKVAQQSLKNKSLDLQIAKTQQKLGQVKDAKQTLNQILERHPDFKAAQDMLKTL